MSPKLPRQQSSDVVTLYISLVPFLKENSPVSVAETATHFGVPRQVIIEAVNNLYYMGPFDRSGIIPGGSMFEFDMELFDDGRGEIHLSQTPSLERSPRLSAREATTILAGLQLLNAAANSKSQRVIAGLIQKISLGRPDEVAPISIEPVLPSPVISAANSAISSGQQMSITYVHPEGPATDRIIDPLRIDYVGSSWFIRGWCHLRDARRTFRSDRITKFEVLDRPICHSDTVSSADESLFDEAETDFIAIVELPAWLIPLVSDFAPTFVGTSPHGQVHMSVRFARVSNAIRFVSRHPGLISVIEPHSVRDAIAQWALSRG